MVSTATHTVTHVGGPVFCREFTPLLLWPLTALMTGWASNSQDQLREAKYVRFLLDKAWNFLMNQKNPPKCPVAFNKQLRQKKVFSCFWNYLQVSLQDFFGFTGSLFTEKVMFFFTESLLYFMSSLFWNKHTKLWLTISRKPLNLNLQAVSIKPQCVCVVCRFGPLMCAVYDFTGPQFLFDQPETCEDFQFAFATKSPQSAKKENNGNDFPFSFNF